MINIKSQGDFKNIERFFLKMTKSERLLRLEQYGRQGVDALSSATPVDAGLTASSWGYEIHSSNGNVSLQWTNSNNNKGVNIAILIQYGHGTGTGGYVQGRDFINPAIRPVFDKIAEDMWREVTDA